MLRQQQAAPMSAPARPTLTKRKAIFAFSRHHAEVAGERDHRARAGGDAVERGDDGLAQLRGWRR